MEPSEGEKEMILNIMEPYYRGCSVNVDDFDTYEHFRVCLGKLDMQSSPGYPLMMEKTTIGDWLGYNGVTFNEIQVEKLWLMVQEILEGEFDCLWRVFIKQEPHKIHKILSKRYRLILCPPLPVQMVWQMLFAKQNNREIEKSYFIPSQQGIILPYGNWKLYYDQWKRQGTTWGTDATAWDWTLPGWVLQLDLKFRERQVFGLRVNDWLVVAERLYRDAFKDCKVVFSNGRVFQQQYWGIMKSGCVNTISSNSHGGMMFHILYSLEANISVEPAPKCVGDDKLVAEQHCQYLEIYEKYGNKIKSVSEMCEFVGHEFHDEGPRPMYIGKHVYNFLYVKDENMLDTIESYLRLNALYDSGWNFWIDIVNRLGLSSEVLSRRYYKSWYNNPDGAKMVKG